MSLYIMLAAAMAGFGGNPFGREPVPPRRHEVGTTRETEEKMRRAAEADSIRRQQKAAAYAARKAARRKLS